MDYPFTQYYLITPSYNQITTTPYSPAWLPAQKLRNGKNRNYIIQSFLQMQQMQKAAKSFEIDDTTLNIPYGVRKRLQISKKIQAMSEPTQYDNERSSFSKSETNQNKELAVPYEMSQAFIKYMLFYRIVSYLVALSLLLSILSVYGGLHEMILILANNGITLSIWVASVVKLRLYTQYIRSKKQNMDTMSIIHICLQILILIPHPTIWTLDHNLLLHLLVMLRIFIIIKFLIESSVYYNVRAYRIININGLNANQHFFFAVKSLVQSLNIGQILATMLFSVLFFTHCLYLVGLEDDSRLNVVDCFEIVIVTMPTIGFGEYQVPFLSQKIILFFTVVFGAVLNSFVTLSMLSQLEMNQAELSSYWLFKKINTRESIENISKNYIQKSFNRIRQKKTSSDKTKKQINFSFRNEYRLRKSLYNSISYTDINNLFAYYRDGLIEYKNSVLQTANMVSVLLRALDRHNFVKAGNKWLLRKGRR